MKITYEKKTEMARLDGSSSLLLFSLEPNNEIVGEVLAITGNSIALDCSRRITVNVRVAGFTTKRQNVKVGDIIGILALEEGNQRIRVIKNA